MSTFAKLQSLSLTSWPTLSLGLKKGWASKDDISNYATKMLTTGQDNNDLNVALLIGTDSLSQEEIIELIDKICISMGVDLRAEESLAVDKWRLAHLSDIQESSLSDEKKTNVLQELYAEFDYPEDMATCSIYHQSETDPLTAMQELIAKLKLALT